MEFRARPKSNYLQNADWQELHVLAVHWQSDLDFFQDELNFINLLFDKYFKQLTEKQNIDKTKELTLKLEKANAERVTLEKNIVRHVHHLEELMKNPLGQKASVFREDHAALEDDLTEFVKNFRKIKSEIFKFTEQIVRTEKAKHLLTD